MVAENPVECLDTRSLGCSSRGDDSHALLDDGRAGPNEFAIDIDDAGVAGLDWPQLGVIAHLRQGQSGTIDYVDQTFAWFRLSSCTIDGDVKHNRFRVDAWLPLST
jgi:hypothetical protein